MSDRRVQPKRRRLPGAHDDGPFRVFMITTFWVGVLGLALLFVHWVTGLVLLGLALLCFLGALVFGG